MINLDCIKSLWEFTTEVTLQSHMGGNMDWQRVKWCGMGQRDLLSGDCHTLVPVPFYEGLGWCIGSYSADPKIWKDKRHMKDASTVFCLPLVQWLHSGHLGYV